MTFLRVAIFTIPILFFLIFPMPDVGASVPNDIERVECTDIDQIPRSECNALVALYEKTDGPSWKEDEDWLKTDEPCRWYGVTCDESKSHVTELNLNGRSQTDKFGLKGALPAEIGNLKQLKILNVSYNDLESLPQEIGLLTNLQEIYLCKNQLTNIPREIGNLSALTDFYFDRNMLRELPAEVGKLSNIKRMLINGNKLTSLPEDFTALTPRRTLNAGHNHLAGSMSYSLRNWLNTYDPDWNDNQPPLTPSGDSFEPDGSCRFSRSLRIGDSPLRHNFHQARDEDWLQVDLQAGVTYRLLASGIHNDARPEFEIHSGCDTLPVAGGPAFGNENELTFTSDSDQRYYVKIWNNNVNIFGQDITYEVSISEEPNPIQITYRVYLPTIQR